MSNRKNEQGSFADVAADKGFMAKKNGQLFKNLKLSGQVEATGDLSNFLDDFGLLCDNI